MTRIDDGTTGTTVASQAKALATTDFVRLESPIGRIELTANDAGEIVAVVIEHDGSLPRDGLAERATPLLRTAAGQLQEYFAGSRTAFSVPLAAAAGTDFQRVVWQRIAEIPFGERATYGQIARDVGKPGAGRAVGLAVAANIRPLLVGCHRVLGASDRITGYSQGAGVVTKQWLLNHEGTPYRPLLVPIPVPVPAADDQPRLLATTSSTTSSSSPAAP